MLTFLNLDAMVDCLWRARRKSNEMFPTTDKDDISALQIGMYIPLMAVFEDGEAVDIYIGGLASKIKKKKKDLLWDHRSLLYEFSKNTPFSNFDTGMRNDEPIVALLVCCKYAALEATQHVQFRFLTQKRLESVLRGAKTHRLDGYIVQYHQRRLEPDHEGGVGELLQCIWTTHSFDVRKTHGTALECFTEKFRPPRVCAMKNMAARFQPTSIPYLKDFSMPMPIFRSVSRFGCWQWFTAFSDKPRPSAVCGFGTLSRRSTAAAHRCTLPALPMRTTTETMLPSTFKERRWRCSIGRGEMLRVPPTQIRYHTPCRAAAGLQHGHTPAATSRRTGGCHSGMLAAMTGPQRRGSRQ